MDAATLKLAKNYTNEQVVQKATNSPVEEISFDGGIYSVGNNVVNGQVSDVKIKGLTATNLIKNGNFADGTNGWVGTNAIINVSDNKLQVIPNGTANVGWLVQNTSYSIFPSRKYFIKARLRVTNSDCLEMKVIIRSTGGSGDSIYFITAPVANQWYSLAIILDSQATHAGNFRLLFAHEYADAATANGKIMEVQEVMVIDLIAHGLESKTVEELTKMFANYFDGTKSTNSVRVKSVGKNLFDGVIHSMGLGMVIGETVNTRGAYCPALPGQAYSVSRTKLTNRFALVFTHDEPKDGVEWFGGTGLNPSNYNLYKLENIIAPENAKYVFVYLSNNSEDCSDIGLQLEAGSTATEYEPYKESIVNVNLPEPLRSLPNGVKDEVNVSTGVKTQRNKEKILQASDIPMSYTAQTTLDYAVIQVPAGYIPFNTVGTVYLENYSRGSDDLDTISNIGKIANYDSPSGRIIAGFAKGTSLVDMRTALVGKSLTYQLAEPIITKLPAQPPLQVFENGTVYVEPIGDPAETTVPGVEMTIPTGTSNKFGIATHDYDGAAADWVLTNSESKCFLLAVSNAGGSANIIAPDAPGVMYAISNASGYTITIKISGGNGVEITNAKTVLVIHNGTDYTALTAEL